MRFSIPLLLFISISLRGQNTFQLEGKVLDMHQNPVQLLAIKVLEAKDTTRVKYYAFTDEGGNYAIKDIAEGKYILQFDLIGFETYQTTLYVHENVRMETIVLSEKNINLEEVTLIAQQKAIEKTDEGVRLNVKGTPLENKKDVMSILKYAPNMDGLQILGSSDIKLLINGKEVKISPAQFPIFLSSIKPSSIKNIEITDRGNASFAGNESGQLNIIMEREEGVSGYVSGTSMRNNRYGAVNNLGVFYTKNDFRFYTNYYNAFHTSSFQNQDVQVIDNDLTYNIERDGNLKRQERNFMFGLDFKLNARNSISFLYNYMGDNDREYKIVSEQNIQSSLVRDSLIKNNRDFEHIYKVHTLSFQYEKTLDTLGSRLVLSNDFATDSYRNPLTDKNLFFSDFQLVDTSETLQDEKTSSDIYAVQLSWLKKFQNNNSFSIGSKYSFNKNGDSFKFFDRVDDKLARNENFSNEFDFNENIYAFYSDYTVKFKKSSLSVGLRFEYNINRFGENRLENTNDNFKWLPTINYNISAGDSHNITVYASKKIDRPSYYSYNPTLIVTSPTQASSGNKNLNPVDIYRLQVGYTFKRKYSATLRYDYLENNIISIPEFIDEGGFTLSHPANTGYRNNLYLMMSIPVKLFKWWESTNKFNLNYTNFSTTLIVPKQNFEATYGSINSYHSFALTENLTFDFNLSYASPRKSMYTRFSDNFSAGTELSSSFLKDKIQLSISISDLFNTERNLSEYRFNEIFRRTNSKSNSRTIYLSFNYNFAFGKEVNKDFKDSNIEEEKSRVMH
jgi:hypothetical protein